MITNIIFWVSKSLCIFLSVTDSNFPKILDGVQIGFIIHWTKIMDVSPPMNMYDWHKTIHYLIFPQSLARSDKKSSLRPMQSQSDLRLASNSIILLAAQIINDRSITFGYEPFAMAKPFLRFLDVEEAFIEKVFIKSQVQFQGSHPISNMVGKTYWKGSYK